MTTRWTTTLSSKVNLPYVINVRASVWSRYVQNEPVGRARHSAGGSLHIWPPPCPHIRLNQHRTPCTPHLTPYPTPYTLHPAPNTLHPTPYTLHPTPYTVHPAPYALHPTPYTLHPTPSILHPAHYTLHPAHTWPLSCPHTRLRASSSSFSLLSLRVLEGP